jgi:transposase
MSTIKLTENQWTTIVAFLRSHPKVYVGQEANCRRFIEGVLWVLRSGAQWREVPERYGNWNTIYQRYARWCERGIWTELHQAVAGDPDLEYLILDSTVIRAHPCAAGAPAQRGGQAEQALGRSRGGFSPKIHIRVDALGNPLRFKLTAGQRHDITQAQALSEGFDSDFLIADKSYDADEFRRFILSQGIEPVIPSRAKRREPQHYDDHLYKERHVVECFINKLKYYRHLFSRFDKLASRYLGFLSFAAALIWLR